MLLVKKIASVAILAVILALVYLHFSNYFTWPPPAYSSPGVFNLTEEKIEWEVHYGVPELCGKVECHLLPDYSSANFEKRQVLPVREFPLKDYRQGQIIYYRSRVRLPDVQGGEPSSLVLHSMHIWAVKYAFYVDGHFVESGGMDSFNITIPSNLIPEDRQVTMMFRVDPGSLHYQGLAHMGDLVVGQKEYFAPLLHSSFDLRNGYYLWHLLPRLTACLVFVLFSLTLSRQDEFFGFVLYAFVGATHIYLISDLPKSIFTNVEAKAWINPIAGVTCSLLFVAVVHRFFRRPFGVVAKVASLAALLVIFGLVVASFVIPVGQLHLISNGFNYAIRFAGSVYAIWLSVTTWQFLRRTGKSDVRQRMSVVLFIFSLASFMVSTLGLFKILSQGTAAMFIMDTILIVTFSALVGHEFSTTIVQRDQMKNTFKRFMGATVVDRLVHGASVIKPNERLASVMFSDIRNFTPMCESMSPVEVFDFLNEYLEMMVAVITRHGGLIDKFGGDSIMVVWGAPDEDSLHVQKAAACALEMRAALAEFNLRRVGQGLQPIRIGIGIHSGPVISGAVGSQERQEFTVLGDTVNTAARVEGLTKQHDTDIIVSGATWKLLGAAAAGRRLGTAQVKGKSRELEIFALEALQSAGAREEA
jgi:class 3 adenylate cyclase